MYIYCVRERESEREREREREIQSLYIAHIYRVYIVYS
jgi:hypothetical protein